MAGGASEIKLSYEILEEKVTELNTLLSECDGLDMATETPVGGGEYLTFVTQIDEAYADIRSAMSALISIPRHSLRMLQTVCARQIRNLRTK